MKLQDFIKKHGNVSVNEEDLKELLELKIRRFCSKCKRAIFVVSKIRKVDRYALHLDTEVFKNSEVFRTEEEVKEHAKKQRFLLRMKRDFLDNSDEIDWSNEKQAKYYLIYNHYHNKMRFAITYDAQIPGFCTTNKKWLEQYIQEYENEIKEYYFGIREEENE